MNDSIRLSCEVADAIARARVAGRSAFRLVMDRSKHGHVTYQRLDGTIFCHGTERADNLPIALFFYIKQTLPNYRLTVDTVRLRARLLPR